jgi:hypothetical protein
MLFSQVFKFKEIFGDLSTQRILYHIYPLFLKDMFTHLKSTTMLRTVVLEHALQRMGKIQTALINLRLLIGLIFSTGVITTWRISLSSLNKPKRDGHVHLQTLLTHSQFQQHCTKLHQMSLNLS